MMKYTHYIVLSENQKTKTEIHATICKENVLNTYTFSLNLIAAYRLISELVVIQFTDRIHLELEATGGHFRFSQLIIRNDYLTLRSRQTVLALFGEQFDDANRKTKIKENAFFIMLKTHNVKQTQPHRHLSDLIRDLHVTE